MADAFNGGDAPKAGQTSVSIPIRLITSAGAGVTGKVAADLTASYWRQGGSPTSISLSNLAAITSSYTSGGVKETSGADPFKGIYRLDLPNAALATGANWVVIGVSCAGAIDYQLFIPLATAGDSDNAATLALVKTKTDQLTFTVANEVDANTQGGGTSTFIFTVTVASNPVSGALVEVSTDSAGNNRIRQGTTDSLGVVTFRLNAGVYYFWTSRSGDTFTNPSVQTVT